LAGGPDPKAQSNVPTRQLENATVKTEVSGHAPGQSAFNPFDFSPLGQVQSIFHATGYFGSPALSGLNQYVGNRLGSYLNSGRRFGFFPQAFNSDVYSAPTPSTQAACSSASTHPAASEARLFEGWAWSLAPLGPDAERDSAIMSATS
jgi:hypothetical protein